MERGGRLDIESTRYFRRSLEKRIGAQRYGLWFAEGAAVEVLEGTSDGPAVRVVVEGAFARDWLQRSFHADLVAVAREVLGAAAAIDWTVEPTAGRPDDTARAEPVAALPPPSPAAALPSPATGALVPVGHGIGPAPFEAPQPLRPPAAPRLAGFVVGAGNRMAWTAVEMLLERPGQVSPLVLVGPGGCGKTHLLEGLGESVRDRRSPGAVSLQTAEQFTTAFLQALHAGQAASFRRAARSVDLFAIDDLQFFAGRNARATVTELLHTIDALLRRGRQVVLAADRDPETIVELGSDLQTRLRGGMTARILPPDMSLRQGIVASLATRRGLALGAGVVEFVAARLVRHPRELVGAVNRLEATSKMLGTPIDLGLAEEALADLVRACRRGIRLADVDRAVCTALGLPQGGLQARSRGRAVNHPRMLAMFLARRHTSAPLAEIGAYFGRRSHSTVLSAQRTVEQWLAAERPLVLADATWRITDAVRRVEDVLLVGEGAPGAAMHVR